MHKNADLMGLKWVLISQCKLIEGFFFEKNQIQLKLFIINECKLL